MCKACSVNVTHASSPEGCCSEGVTRTPPLITVVAPLAAAAHTPTCWYTTSMRNLRTRACAMWPRGLTWMMERCRTYTACAAMSDTAAVPSWVRLASHVVRLSSRACSTHASDAHGEEGVCHMLGATSCLAKPFDATTALLTADLFAVQNCFVLMGCRTQYQCSISNGKWTVH